MQYSSMDTTTTCNIFSEDTCDAFLVLVWQRRIFFQQSANLLQTPFRPATRQVPPHSSHLYSNDFHAKSPAAFLGSYTKSPSQLACFSSHLIFWPTHVKRPSEKGARYTCGHLPHKDADAAPVMLFTSGPPWSTTVRKGRLQPKCLSQSLSKRVRTRFHHD